MAADLGNRAVQTGKGRIQIKNPGAAEDLLDLAFENSNFFCSCAFPGSERHKDNCHRMTIASLLLGIATHRQWPVEIVEWPGGEPKEIKRKLSAIEVRKVRNGALSIPLSSRLPNADLLGLPWGSLCQVGSGDEIFPAIVGPARYQSGSWYLPLPYEAADIYADMDLGRYNAAWWRHRYGFESRTASM